MLKINKKESTNKVSHNVFDESWIRKDFAASRVNEPGNIPRCGVVLQSSNLEIPYRLNQKNRRPHARAYKRFRKRIETGFHDSTTIL